MKTLDRVLTLLALTRGAASAQWPLSDLAAMLDVRPEVLQRELEEFACVEVPELSAANMIDLLVEDDTVSLRVPSWLEAPVALSAIEALAVQWATEAEAADSPVLTEARKQVAGAIAQAQRPLFEALSGRYGVATDGRPEVRRALGRALVQRRQVEILYRTAEDQRAWRTVHPYGLETQRGHSYLVAAREGADPRAYRIDRIDKAVVTDAAAVLDPSVQPQQVVALAVTVPERGQRAVLRFVPEVAHTARAYYSGQIQPDGALLVEVPYLTEEYLLRVAMQWGGAAEIVSPASARGMQLQMVERLLELHASVDQSSGPDLPAVG